MAPFRLVFGEDERVAKWCQERLPQFMGWNGAYRAIGYERGGILVGGVVFTDYTGANITVSIALEAPLTRRFVRAVFYYPFLQLNVRRLTAIVHERNSKSRRLVESAGWRQEGIVRDGAPDGDLILYGMLKAECRYI